MEQILELLKAIGLPPTMLGTIVIFTILLRYARGTLRWVTPGLSYLMALGFGGIGAWMELPPASTPQAFAHTIAAITVVVLLGQRALQSLAEKVPWLPKDNEWVAGTAAPPAPSPPQP